MEYIIHRVNSINELKKIKKTYGVEIDIRSNGSKLILNHEPFVNGESFINYIDEYRHGTLVLNIKEAGIENTVLKLIKQRPYITSYFLLDVEFPYIYVASRQGEKNIAIRYSEDESIDTVKNYINKLNWVWIDTNSRLPIDKNNIQTLNNFKKCMVCPSRWKQTYKISQYLKFLKSNNFKIDAIMTSLKNITYYNV
tara:strand:- start:670 stop:1257 length:588 start_codon:yes stop_codon:yes gene_type:complete